MIQSLNETCLQNIGANYALYNPLDLVKLPLRLLQELLKHLSIKHLENFDDYIISHAVASVTGDSDRIWRAHVKFIWNICHESNNESSFKCRYFEQLFVNTRALKNAVHVRIANSSPVHILDLSLSLIEKHQIKKEAIEYSPVAITPFKNTERKKWNSKWNVHIKRLTLTHNMWYVIEGVEDYFNSFLVNVTTLTLSGYPQSSDILALKYALRLLTEGNVTRLVLKFPHRVLLKAIVLVFRNLDKIGFQLTREDIKFSSRSCLEFKNEITRIGTYRSYLWRTQSRGVRHFQTTNRLNAHSCRSRPLLSQLRNLYNDNEVNLRQSSFDSEQESDSSTDTQQTQQSSDLDTIEEEHLVDSGTEDVIYVSPSVRNKACFLKCLEIHSVHHKSNILLLSTSLLEMSFVEDLTLAYVNPYSAALEETLLKLVYQDRLKKLSLSSIKLSYGSAGFVYQLLLHPSSHRQNEDCMAFNLWKPLKLANLKLELVKSQNTHFENVLRISPCRKTFLKKLQWKEGEFTHSHMKILQILLEHSEQLEHLDLKSIRQSSYLAPCLIKIIKSCPNLRELYIKQFLLNQLNELNKLLVLLENNQLKVLHIESCEISEQHASSEKLENAFSQASNLETLVLANNMLKDEFMDRFCEAIKRNTNSKLQSVDLSYNRLTLESIRKLCNVFKDAKMSRNSCLKTLKVNGNRCETSSLYELKRIFRTLSISL